MSEVIDNDKKAEESDTFKTTPQTELHRIFPTMFTSRLMLGALLMYAGFGVVFFFYLQHDYPFSYVLERYGAVLIGSILCLAGFYLFYDEMNKRRTLRRERFVDVDARSRPASDAAPYVQLIEKISALEESSKATVQEVIERFKATQPQTTSKNPDGFVEYFDSIRRVLEQKAAIADEKASILLDKGTSYSRFGITFFIFSIVAWQLIANATGFQTQHIYGIASCSLLFVFVEFLSAWFLKQYRQFVDTSTYLIKVKSIFDKYMLVYCVGKEATALGHDTKKSTIHLIEMLKGEIRWPDSYLTKNPDISFAREALETMSLLARNMKSEVKAVSTKPAKETSGA